MNPFLPKIDLCRDHWEMFQEALWFHVPDCHVLAFGSIANLDR